MGVGWLLSSRRYCPRSCVVERRKKEENAIWAVKGNSVCIHWNNDWDNGKKACFRMLRKDNVIISKAITKGATDSKLKLKPGNPFKLTSHNSIFSTWVLEHDSATR